jgi:hypothetical protein
MATQLMLITERIDDIVLLLQVMMQMELLNQPRAMSDRTAKAYGCWVWSLCPSSTAIAISLIGNGLSLFSDCATELSYTLVG